MEIIFGQLPPSENKIRVIRVIGRRPAGMAYTKEASNYKKDFKAHVLKQYASEVVNFAKEHKYDSVYKVHIKLYFNKNQIVNKGWPKTKTYFKKMDVGNRRKLLEDCLAEALGIDDMYTFDLRMTKLSSLYDNPLVSISINRVDKKDYGL
tara:strand:+ start:98 stop:547 length:450 start_codon:yes stop_codon:yes gene_type:complete